mgnify:FL=1
MTAANDAAGHWDPLTVTLKLAKAVQGGRRDQQMVDALRRVDRVLGEIACPKHPPATSEQAEAMENVGAAWGNLGNAWSDMGMREEALGAAQQACAWLRFAMPLGNQAREWFPATLTNLGRDLSALGRREEALQATQEAVGLYRELHRTRPEAFAPDLATSLNGSAASRDRV